MQNIYAAEKKRAEKTMLKIVTGNEEYIDEAEDARFYRLFELAERLHKARHGDKHIIAKIDINALR